jgi:DNA gyrase subunit A
LVVKEHQELVFISQNGIVQRTGVRGINRYGRASQGVRLMKLREADEVSAVALVVESDAPAENGNGDGSTPVLEAGGETVAVEPAGEDDGDGVVAIDPPSPGSAADDESEDA